MDGVSLPLPDERGDPAHSRKRNPTSACPVPLEVEETIKSRTLSTPRSPWVLPVADSWNRGCLAQQLVGSVDSVAPAGIAAGLVGENPGRADLRFEADVCQGLAEIGPDAAQEQDHVSFP
jgi:hypothetical protein